ncbi:MAG: hypothetical protein ACKVH8_11965 [Pirellulales bacterium]
MRFAPREQILAVMYIAMMIGNEKDDGTYTPILYDLGCENLT